MVTWSFLGFYVTATEVTSNWVVSLYLSYSLCSAKQENYWIWRNTALQRKLMEMTLIFGIMNIWKQTQPMNDSFSEFIATTLKVQSCFGNSIYVLVSHTISQRRRRNYASIELKCLNLNLGRHGKTQIFLYSMYQGFYLLFVLLLP